MMNSNQPEVINGFPNGGATAKLLVSFTDAEASKHYFCTSSLGGGEVSHLCTLPGCDNGNPYVSDVINGIMCFSNGKDVYVLNPATGDILTLPRSQGYDKFCQSNLKNLPYSVYAFGFDPSKKEYKVLHVFGVPQCPGSPMLHNQQCEVFTVNGEKPKEVKEEKPTKEVKKDGRKHKGDKKEEEEEEEEDEGDVWRKAVSLPPCPRMFRGQGVYVNGSVYWLGVSSSGEDAIVCFDVASEMFRSVTIPFMLPHRPSLSHVRGRLAIQGIEKATGSSPTLGVWILEDIKEESKWNKNTVEIVDPKEQKGVKFHVLVGDDSTGDMVVMRSVIPERYEVVCLSGNKNTAAERTITLGGLPSWVDLQRGNKLNVRIDNYVESRVPLDPIVVKVKKEKIPEAKEDGATAKKTYYGKANGAQTRQPSRASQYVERTHDGHGQARGAQTQQFSRAPQPSGQRGRGQARGSQTQEERPQTSQYVQRTPGPAQSHPMTRGGQPARQPPTQKTHNGCARPSSPPPPPANQSVQRTHPSPAQSAKVALQASSQPTQHNGGVQLSSPPAPASQPAQGTIRYGRAQPPPRNHGGARQTLIRIGEINVQVST